VPLPIGCVFTQLGGSIMGEKTQFDSAYQLVAGTFAELGATGPVIHTILLKDCHFGGDKFRCEGMHAIWAAGSDVIEFFDEKGELKLQKKIPVEREEAAA
jgi:hypothetical protein